jgi:hypothetical protein
MTLQLANMSPELLAFLEKAAVIETTNTITIGFSLGLLEWISKNRTSKNGKTLVIAPVKGDLFTSNCPLIKAGGRLTTIEQANDWLWYQGELAIANNTMLDCSIIMDFGMIAFILKEMAKGKMTYAKVTFQKVEGIHKRLVQDKDGNFIPALTVDMYDRTKESLVIEAASNPTGIKAIYCDDDAEWEKAVIYASEKKLKGMNNWKKLQEEKGKTEESSEQSAPSLDDLEDEEVSEPLITA